jgi:hypothetical protein
MEDLVAIFHVKLEAAITQQLAQGSKATWHPVDFNDTDDPML